MTVAAALPAHQLLLIGTDLANSRCLYLPTVGWAILWGAIIGSVEKAHWRMLLTVWIVAWNLTMLRHDLAFWLRVPAEARQVCADFGATVAAREGSAVAAGRVKVGEPGNYRWDAATAQIKAAN